MYFSRFQLHNYKSYYNTGWIELAPGFNVVTGQNNAGKTALLEGIGLTLTANPHLSLISKDTATTPLNSMSWVNVTVKLSSEELWNLLTYRGEKFQMFISYPHRESELARKIGIESFGDEAADAFIGWLFSRDVYEFDLSFQRIDFNKGKWDTLEPHLSCFGIPVEPAVHMNLGVDPFGRQLEAGSNKTGHARHDFGVAIADLIEARVYSFKAERYGFDECARGESRTLKSDASNLAAVLDNLQTNSKRFSQYTDLVKEVLPQVRQVAVRTNPGNERYVKTYIWTDDAALERDDLAFSLSECGTGVSQVLAILYVIFTSKTQRKVIVIDEPQSFLHPGAVRKLIDILKQHSEHQYVIATNTPTVIMAANLSTISLVKQVGAQSTVESLDVKKTENQSLWLNEVGASLSDVFGLDKVLWVEGKTEELCFKMILEQVANYPLMGLAIVGVVNTGYLESRDAQRIHEIYMRLTVGGGLIPPAIGFIFDREGRTRTEREDLERASRQNKTGHIHFLPRRLYENYLLDSRAIASVANSIEGFRDIPISEQEVSDWIASRGDDARYNRRTSSREDDVQDWITSVNGALLLHDLFTELSGARVQYVKVVHSVALTQWLIENEPDKLQEVVQLLTQVLRA
ncbi:MAG: AAA family ATPase [Pyrinomonadaceae bacterium]